MDSPHYQRRKRAITACIECVRRKQRCDRGKPCSGCKARNVEDRCIFSNDTSRSHESLDRTPAGEPESPDLATSLGYPIQNEMSATLRAFQAPPACEPSPASTVGSSQQHQSSISLSRYRMLISKLPAETVIEQLTNIYFSEADWYFCLVDRPYYEELWQSWKSQYGSSASPNARSIHSESVTSTGGKTTFVKHALETRYFPAMLFQMLALTLHFLPASCPARDELRLVDQSASDKMSKVWSETGHEIMSLLGRIDSPLTAVLADMLRCTWLKNSGLGGHSWHVLCDAVRQAQSLGLHQKAVIPKAHTIEDTLGNLWHDEHRRRVWISVFSWDAHMALSLGRPRLIVAEDCTAEIPLDCDLPTEPCKVIPTTAAVADQSSSYTSQLFKYSIGLLIHEAMSSGALKSPCKDYNIITRLHQQVNDVINNLPIPYSQTQSDSGRGDVSVNLSRQMQQISIIASTFIMSLHRPHVIQRATSRAIAVSAALDTLTASQSLFELCTEQHFKIHTILFYNIDAVIFLSSMVLIYSQSDKMGFDIEGQHLPYREICSAIYQAVERVAAMKSRSNVAREAEKALRKCYELVTMREQEFSALNNTPQTPDPRVAIFTTTRVPLGLGSYGLPTEAPALLSAGGNIDTFSSQNQSIATSYPTPFPGLADTSSFEDMSEFLFNPEILSIASNTTAWMAQHAFVDDMFLSSDPMLGQEFHDWRYP